MKTQAPPTPPVSTAQHTTNGMVYAISSTETSYAFSGTFREDLLPEVIKSISKEFSQYSSDFLYKDFRKEIPATYMYSIQVKQTELKLEYKLYTNTGEKNKKQQKIGKRFKKLENVLTNL